MHTEWLLADKSAHHIIIMETHPPSISIHSDAGWIKQHGLCNLCRDGPMVGGERH